MAWKHDRERFPPHRFELIGPGKYREKATGATWVDSRDMEHAFDESADEAENRRADLAKARKARPEPPEGVREEAARWELRHRARLEGRVVATERRRKLASERERVALRRGVLLKIRAYWQAQGMPEPEHVEPELLVLAECDNKLDELEAVDEAHTEDVEEPAGDGGEPRGGPRAAEDGRAARP